MLTILQGSDLHFGSAYDPDAGKAFRRAIEESTPDLVVIAGDLTQRAKVREYREAQRFLESLGDLPVVVTPGNHDVPLYRAFERLLDPFRNYRRYVSPDLDTVTRVPGAVVVALNTAAPRRAIVNGRLAPGQLEFAARIFQESHAHEARIVVAHHPLVSPLDGEPAEPLRGATGILEALRDMGAELVMGGHFHRGFVACSSSVCSAQEGTAEVVLAYSGTATSTRGRASEASKNSFNLLMVDEDTITVEHRLLDRDSMTFESLRETVFPRRGRASGAVSSSSGRGP
ncbi:MAG: metallophosphoesterase [Gemmatimonadota bacterium]|nr:MAG: metallophosphoesterase [Gemmatimonadota bacterium]